MWIFFEFKTGKVEKRARAQHLIYMPWAYYASIPLPAFAAEVCRRSKPWAGFENIFWFPKHNITVSNNLLGRQTSSRKASFLSIRASTITLWPYIQALRGSAPRGEARRPGSVWKFWAIVVFLKGCILTSFWLRDLAKKRFEVNC